MTPEHAGICDWDDCRRDAEREVGLLRLCSEHAELVELPPDDVPEELAAQLTRPLMRRGLEAFEELRRGELPEREHVVTFRADSSPTAAEHAWCDLSPTRGRCECARPIVLQKCASCGALRLLSGTKIVSLTAPGCVRG